MDEHRLVDVMSAWKRHVTKTFKPGADSTWTFSEAAPGAPEHSEEQVFIPDASGADAPAEYLSVLSSGFVIGKRVMLLKRVTGLVQDEEKLKNEEELTRKDVQVEAMGTITDVPFDASGKVVVSFEIDQSSSKSKRKRPHVVVSARVNVADLELSSSAEPPAKQPRSAEAASNEAPRPAEAVSPTLAKYPFLEKLGSVAEVCEGWEAHQFQHGAPSDEMCLTKSKAQVVLAMLAMLPEKPLSSDEILLVSRGGAHCAIKTTHHTHPQATKPAQHPCNIPHPPATPISQCYPIPSRSTACTENHKPSPTKTHPPPFPDQHPTRPPPRHKVLALVQVRSSWKCGPLSHGRLASLSSLRTLRR